MEKRRVSHEVKGIAHRDDLKHGFDKRESAEIESCVDQGVLKNVAEFVVRKEREYRRPELLIRAGEIVSVIAKAYWHVSDDDPHLRVESESGVIGRVLLSRTNPIE